MPALARNLGLGYLALCLLLLGSMLAGGPRFYAPLGLVPEHQREPVTLRFAYSSEKEDWLKAALAAYEQSAPEVDGRPVKLELVNVSSGQMREDILSGKLQAAAISPASMLELRLLDARWSKAKGGQSLLGADQLAPQPLVQSPLVLVAWRNKGEKRWPDGMFTWSDINQAVTAQDQNYLRISHTRPTSSNSGLMALLLASYEFYQQKELTPDDIQGTGFQQYLTSLEQNLTWASDASFDSSRRLVESMVARGPASFDGVLTYENLALQYAANPRVSGNELHLYYPRANIWADHPFAILNGAWVTPEQQEAARELRDYLLAPEAQRLARNGGFRPTSQQISIGEAGAENPFNKTEYGVRPAIDQLVKEPPVEVAEALLDFWRSSVNK